MPKTSHKLSFDKMRNIVFFTLIIILSIAMLYIVRPFFYPIFWAAVIAIMFSGFYQWLGKHFRSSALNTSLTMLAVFIILLLPLFTVSALLLNESIQLYRSVSTQDLTQALDTAGGWVENTAFAPYVETAKTQWPNYIEKAAKTVSGIIFTSVTSITKNSLRFVLMLFIMFYSLYYFIKDGKKMLSRLMHLSPLGDKYEKMLYTKFTSTTRATLKSTLIVGGVQGFLSGLLFWITGIEGAFIWGVIMVVVAIVPAVGPPIILAPAAIVMLILGNVWQGVILLVGAVVVGFLDNLMRPPLIGKDTQMHPLIVFLATLGGLILFGVSGFIIGPIIAALYLSVMSIYDHYYHAELHNN